MLTSDMQKRKPSRVPELALTVQYDVRTKPMPSRAKFGKWVRAALKKSACITLRIVGAREGRLLNRHFRRRDYATNVLTFVYSKRQPLDGDIAICAPVTAREAREMEISREAHYAHLTVHAVLHLQGHDHQRARDAGRMEQLETRILAGLGYADPYEKSQKVQAARAARAT